jgi:hypothetical protein
MWAWKYWDVAIAVVGFLVQCGLAYLGLTLTHWKHKTAFGALVTIGLVFTIFAVKRGVDSGDKVQQQLNTIQSNTEHPAPPPQINIPAPTIISQETKSRAYMSFVEPTIKHELGSQLSVPMFCVTQRPIYPQDH